MPTHQRRLARTTRRLVLVALSPSPFGCGDDPDVGAEPAASSTSSTESDDDGTTHSGSAANSTSGSTSSSTSSSSTGPDESLLDRVVEGLGGADAFATLSDFELTVSGQRWVADEGADPADGRVSASDYTATVAIDIHDARIRIDMERTITYADLGIPLAFSEIISGELGAVAGVDNLFAANPDGPLPPDRVAAIAREQRLLNPHLLVASAVADPTLASESTPVDVDGRTYERLVLADPVAPITLWVDAETHAIARLTTGENNWLRRDENVEVSYSDWTSTAGGVSFPNHVVLRVADGVVADEIRSAIAAPAEFAADHFAAAETAGGVLAPEDAARGARNAMALQQLMSIGFPNFGQQTFVDAQLLAPGVWQLGGASHNSIVIEQDDNLVLLETPLYEARCVALLDWIAVNLPDKPVSHAVVSHYHGDHSSCARTLVARGATLVVGAPAEVVWTDVLAAASAIEPDELALDPVADPPIEFVPDGGHIVLDDPTHAVTVFDLPNAHADDMVLPYVDGVGVVFVVDLYNIGFPSLLGPAGAQAILDVLEAESLLGAVALVAAGHGIGTATVDDLITAAAGGAAPPTSSPALHP